MAKEKKTCSRCNRSISPQQFYSTNSVLFSDGRIPFCKGCLKDMMDETDIESVKSVLRQIDKPFLKEVWEKAKSSNRNTIGDYFRQLNSLHQYKGLTWDDSIHYEDDELEEDESGDLEEETDLENVSESQTEHGSIKVDKELKIKWGDFPNRDVIEMEKLYQDMQRANDIETPQHRRQLHLYCKLNVLMDKALNEMDFGGYEKLSRQFQKLTEQSGFRPIDSKSGAENAGIRTFSQVFEEIERDGFIEPFDVNVRQDAIDKEIQYILNYQLKLLNQEQLAYPPEDTPDIEGDNDE